MRLFRILLNGDGAEGNGDGEGAPPKKTPSVDERATDLAKKYPEDMTGLAKHLLTRLDASERDGAKARDRARRAEEQLAAHEGKLETGSLILNPEQARLHEQYKDLGTVKELRAKLREHAEQGERLARLDREAEIDGLAEHVPGLKTAVLKKLVGDQQFELKDVRDSKTGKKTKEVYVKDGTSDPVPIGEYIDEHWSEFKPSLFEGTKQAAPLGTPRRDLAGARTGGRIDIETPGEITREFFEQQIRAQGSLI